MEKRILGEHFGPEGKPKRGFPSHKGAKRFVQERHINAEIYLCTFCKKWHLATIREEE